MLNGCRGEKRARKNKREGEGEEEEKLKSGRYEVDKPKKREEENWRK